MGSDSRFPKGISPLYLILFHCLTTCVELLWYGRDIQSWLQISPRMAPWSLLLTIVPPTLRYGINAVTLSGFFKAMNGVYAQSSFSHSGSTVLSIGEDQLMKLWDLDGSERASFGGPDDNVSAAAFFPDDQAIATGGEDGRVQVRYLAGKEPIMLGWHGGPVLSIDVSPDFRQIATSSHDGSVKIWSINNKRPAISISGHSSTVSSVAFSPDNRFILTASYDGTARLWDRDGRYIRSFEGNQDFVWSALFSPDSKLILTAGKDLTARLWSIDGPELISFKGYYGSSKPVYRGFNGGLACAKIIRNGHYIGVVGSEEFIQFWLIDPLEILQASSAANP